jgi:uncharacterized membrane protein YvbJ
MSLIKCSECGKDVSSKAPSCPFCGNPIVNQNASPTVIEQTGKKWKAVKLISWIVIIFGVILFLSNIRDGGFNNPMTGFGFSMGLFGIMGAIIGKFGAWWQHR